MKLDPLSLDLYNAKQTKVLKSKFEKLAKAKRIKVSGLKLISVGSNAKTIKGDGSEFLTAIMYLAPADTVKGMNNCAFAGIAGCKAPCLFKSGQAKVFPNINKARIRKTILLRDHKDTFLNMLRADLKRFQAYCDKRGIKACVRLNGTSDIQWENDGIMSEFPNIQFYDYTKIVTRFRKSKPMPVNYHLTLSYSGANANFAKKVLATQKRTGCNVAVVWRTTDVIPKTFHGIKVVDGDITDLRFTDEPNVIVSLYAKGDAKKDQSGFVID